MPPFFLRGMAECRGIISLMHYSICERIRRDSRYIAALAFHGFRGQALLQVCSWSLDSLISCKSAGEGDNGPHPRVGGFAPGRGAAHSLRSRKRVEFSHRLRQKKYIGGRGERGKRKRGPFRGQNFCGSPSQVDGHGWPRSRVGGGLTRVPGGRAAKKTTTRPTRTTTVFIASRRKTEIV